MVNMEKSAIMFSKGTTAAAKRKFKGILHIVDEAFSDRYLGLPVHLGRSITLAFDYLKERIWKKIQGWKEKFLSRVGKEILIKAVAPQADVDPPHVEHAAVGAHEAVVVAERED